MDSSFDYPKVHHKQNSPRIEITNRNEDTQKISFSCRYFWSLTGLLRLAIIV